MKTVFVLMIFWWAGCYIYAGPQEIREKVSVLNVEVPVQVYHKGQFVSDLSKDDFRLWVDGKPREINGFYLKNKSIGATRILDGRSIRSKSRFFVLAFSLMEFHPMVPRVLHYLLDHVLKEEDKLLVFCANKEFFFPDVRNKEMIVQKITDTIRAQAKILRIHFLSLIDDIERRLRAMKSDPVGSTGVAKYKFHFFRSYEAAWKTFKIHHRLSAETFYHFSRYLANVDLEKWVVCFYQQQSFPVLDPDFQERNHSLESYYIMKRVSREQRYDVVFPHKEISRLFNRVDTTFHTVIVPTRRKTLSSPELIKQNMDAYIRNNLRRISIGTGGSIQFSGDLKGALKEICARKDLVYVLTYAPEAMGEKGIVKVKINRSVYHPVYDDNRSLRKFHRQMEKEYGPQKEN